MSIKEDALKIIERAGTDTQPPAVIGNARCYQVSTRGLKSTPQQFDEFFRTCGVNTQEGGIAYCMSEFGGRIKPELFGNPTYLDISVEGISLETFLKNAKTAVQNYQEPARQQER